MTSIQQESDGYVLSRTSEEYRRLVKQARFWAEATERSLVKAGLGPGMRALDVGCGPGEVMRTMARLVGPGGAVTGIDIDAKIGAEAMTVLSAEDPSIYRFEPFDLHNGAKAPGAPYDLIFSRLVIFHMPDQPAMLRRLWDWVKPGGALLIMDYDLMPTRSEPPVPAMQQATTLIRQAFRAGGRDIEIGFRMPAHFVSAGLGAPDGCEVASFILDATSAAMMLKMLLVSLRPIIDRFALADEETLAKIDAELSALQPGQAFSRWPDMTATWKRKPLE